LNIEFIIISVSAEDFIHEWVGTISNTRAPVNYLLHMQEHCKYCMQFSYFWNPVLVLREKPVLMGSSDLELEVTHYSGSNP